MAELAFFCGTMDCGKSTLALQMDHNRAARGAAGLLFTRLDRAGRSVLSSRLGLSIRAVEVVDDLDFWQTVVTLVTGGGRVDYLICDEAQFYAPAQVEQLARLVDEMDVDVFAFGITTDFRTRLFPGSQRMIELADRVHALQVEALCWCGRRATHNARVLHGVMVVEGDQVVVGDIGGSRSSGLDGDSGGPGDSAGPVELAEPAVEYEVLCRRHHLRRMPALAARAASASPDVLPFALDAHQ